MDEKKKAAEETKVESKDNPKEEVAVAEEKAAEEKPATEEISG